MIYPISLGEIFKEIFTDTPPKRTYEVCDPVKSCGFSMSPDRRDSVFVHVNTVTCARGSVNP